MTTPISREILAAHKLDRAKVIYPPFAFENPVGISGVSVMTDVRIGRHSYMNDGMIRSRVRIGRYCSIGRNVLLGAGDHPMDALTTHPIALRAKRYPRRPADSKRKPKCDLTEIGNDVWIGDNVVVVAGVRIGDGAVIGANAVVTSDVAPYAVMGGVPARFIRSRFDENLVAALKATRWWRLPETVIQSLDVNDVQGCVDQIPALLEAFGEDIVSMTVLE